MGVSLHSALSRMEGQKQSSGGVKGMSSGVSSNACGVTLANLLNFSLPQFPHL